jgi:ornithine--oxo-acid transaminase
MTPSSKTTSATTTTLIEQAEKWSAHNYHPLPVVLVKGEGVWVYDPDGNRYMDMLSAYSALNQGHRHPRIVQAIKDQADKITLTSPSTTSCSGRSARSSAGSPGWRWRSS